MEAIHVKMKWFWNRNIHTAYNECVWASFDSWIHIDSVSRLYCSRHSTHTSSMAGWDDVTIAFAFPLGVSVVYSSEQEHHSCHGLHYPWNVGNYRDTSCFLVLILYIVKAALQRNYLYPFIRLSSSMLTMNFPVWGKSFMTFIYGVSLCN